MRRVKCFRQEKSFLYKSLRKSSTCEKERVESFLMGNSLGVIFSLASFIQSVQDAKISLERLNEIHSQPDEDTDLDDKVTELPEDRTIRVEHVTFSYDGAERNYALNDVSLEIPERKVTAIVGESGCGKTTLILLPTILLLTAILWMRLDFIRRQRWLM